MEALNAEMKGDLPEAEIEEGISSAEEKTAAAETEAQENKVFSLFCSRLIFINFFVFLFYRLVELSMKIFGYIYMCVCSYSSDFCGECFFCRS